MYEKTAIISACGNYRYELRRIWQPKRGVVLFVMLNPSTADANIDDNTIRRCMGYAATWGKGGIVVGNLFAYRATKPTDLKKAFDPVGPLNDKYLRAMSDKAKITVCAWGNHGKYLNRDKAVLSLIKDPRCLAINKTGTPKHPLFAESWLEPRPFTPNQRLHTEPTAR